MPLYDFFSEQEFTVLGQRWMRQAADHIFTTVSGSVSSLKSVVEIGPGWGVFAGVCNSRRLEYTAIDTNIGLLRRLEKVQTVCSFVPPIPFRNEICDAVVACHVLEHCDGSTRAQELISEMGRIVRRGGCVLIISPDFLWTGDYFWDCDYTHNFPTSSRRLSQLFIDQGLEIINLEYLYNHLSGWRGYCVGRLVSLMPYRYLGSQPHSAGYSERIYRLRMTFSRSVLIVARRAK